MFLKYLSLNIYYVCVTYHKSYVMTGQSPRGISVTCTELWIRQRWRDIRPVWTPLFDQHIATPDCFHPRHIFASIPTASLRTHNATLTHKTFDPLFPDCLPCLPYLHPVQLNPLTQISYWGKPVAGAGRTTTQDWRHVKLNVKIWDLK